MSLAKLFREMVEILEDSGVPHMPTGSLAYSVDQGAAQAALESHGQFDAIDPVGGWRVDLIIKRWAPRRQLLNVMRNTLDHD